MNINIPEPYQMAEQHEEEMNREALKRPQCDGCGTRIFDDDCYVTGIEVYCESCFLKIHIVPTITLMEN